MTALSTRIPIAIAAGAALLSGPGARADVRLPALFSEHMVLQRDVPVPVWGWADPGEEVTVSIAGQSRSVRTGPAGTWSVRLRKLKAAEGLTLTVRGKNTLTVTDVLCGEVWLGSGQSNMAMSVSRCLDFERERDAARLPQVRMFTVARRAAREPQADCAGSWQVCSPDTVGQFSATAYFFGRELHRKLGVPVGLINSSVGGTPIEAWTSIDPQRSSPELAPLLASWEKRAAEFNLADAMMAYDRQLAAHRDAAARARTAGRPVPRAPQRPVFPRDHTHHPAALFNGMIAPLVPYALRGALWYQGENNARTAETGALYATQLPLLVRDWRARWGQGDFPIAWVQLPNFRTEAGGWPLVREAMLRGLSLPSTGMTVNTDIGEQDDIHPRNKQEIGRRLALWARAEVYGENVPWSGPLPERHWTAGGTLGIRFRHADGLAAREGELRGFLIAGPDRVWKPAAARVSGREVLLSNPEVRQPVAARYSWAADPDGNLVNEAGLPASPFRTDDW